MYTDSQPQETESASYTKTKRTDKGSVTISANAESMKDLHDILKLAGITLPADHPAMNEPEPEPEQQEPEQPVVTVSPIDTKYTTDKSAIIDRLRDTLKAKLSH